MRTPLPAEPAPRTPRAYPIPVVAVCDTRAGRGDSPTTVRVRKLLQGAGLELAGCHGEGDVAVQEYGGDLPPRFGPDILIAVVDALQPSAPAGDSARDADIVVLDNADCAPREAVGQALSAIRATGATGLVVHVSSAPRLEPGPSLMDTAVLVVEDGVTVTRGHAQLGPATLAAVEAQVGMRVDPRPFAVGSLRETFRRYPHLGAVLPVMEYGPAHLAEVQATVDAVECDAVVDGTRVDLARAIRTRHPVRRVVRELHELSAPTLADALKPFAESVISRRPKVVTRS